MNFLTAYIQGWWQAILKIRMWLLLYFINIMFAIVATIPFFNLLDEKASHSMAIEKLLPGFDYAVVQDFLNQYGDMFSVLFNHSKVMLILYFILSVFVTGGILEVFKNMHERFSFRQFWGGSSYYFWRLLRLTIYFLLIQGAVIFVFFWLSTTIPGGGLFDAPNELYFYRSLKIILPIYLFIAGLLFTIQDYAKVHIIHTDKGFFIRPFWESFRMVFKHFIPVLLLALLNGLTFAALALMYWMLSKPALTNSTAITISFFVGQTFLFIRIGTKLLNLASATILYKNIMVKKEANDNKEMPSPLIAQEK